MPDESGNGGHADQKHDGSGCKQKAQKSQQKTHHRISVSIPVPQCTIWQIIWARSSPGLCCPDDKALSRRQSRTASDGPAAILWLLYAAILWLLYNDAAVSKLGLPDPPRRFSAQARLIPPVWQRRCLQPAPPSRRSGIASFPTSIGANRFYWKHSRVRSERKAHRAPSTP